MVPIKEKRRNFFFKVAIQNMKCHYMDMIPEKKNNVDIICISRSVSWISETVIMSPVLSECGHQAARHIDPPFLLFSF